MSDQLDTIPCPDCERLTLELEDKLVAKPFGTYSLAGAQRKVAAHYWPYVVCKNPDCGFEKAAKKDGE